MKITNMRVIITNLKMIIIKIIEIHQENKQKEVIEINIKERKVIKIKEVMEIMIIKKGIRVGTRQDIMTITENNQEITKKLKKKLIIEKICVRKIYADF